MEDGEEEVEEEVEVVVVNGEKRRKKKVLVQGNVDLSVINSLSDIATV